MCLRSQHFCPELSRTPMQLFPLDFFVHKVQTKLYRRKILGFEKNKFSLSKFAPTSQYGLKLIYFETRVRRKWSQNFRKKPKTKNLKFFVGTVLFHLDAHENPEEKGCLVWEKVLDNNVEACSE